MRATRLLIFNFKNHKLNQEDLIAKMLNKATVHCNNIAIALDANISEGSSNSAFIVIAHLIWRSNLHFYYKLNIKYSSNNKTIQGQCATSCTASLYYYICII